MQAFACRIVEADPLGVDALALLQEAAEQARELYPELKHSGEPWPTNVPTPPRGVYFLAYSGNQLVGMGSHRPINAKTTEIRRMFVTRTARRSGVARALLEALQTHARSQGFQRLVLETGRKQHAAMALYESCGFHRISPFGPYVGDPTSICYARALSGATQA